MRAAPAVTVCIPVYNREAFIASAMHSVLAQGFGDFELLLIDDGSTDQSAAIMQRCADPRVRFHSNGVNKGLPFTRNRALELARGRYLALLDSDDIMAPRRLERQVQFLERRPDIATVGGWVTRFTTPEGVRHRLMRPLEPEQLRAWLLFRSSHANTTLMGRTAVLREFGYRAEFAVSEDYDLLVRLSRRYRMANIARVLTCMREHAGRTTRCVPAQVQAAKLRLADTQLRELGIEASGDDLQRHFRLTRMGRADWAAWPDYLPWVQHWLEAILRANRRARLFAPAGLAAVVSQAWLITCIQAGAAMGAGRTLHAIRRLRWCAGAGAAVLGNVAFAAGWRR